MFKIMAVKLILKQFAGRTTVHGVPRAINSNSTFARLVWSSVFLMASIMFVAQFIQLLQKYYSRPKKVTVEVVPLPVPFPAISFCNMRNLDAFVLNKINENFINMSDPLYHAENSDHPFVKAYMESVAKYYPMYAKYALEELDVFQTVLTRSTLAANIPRDLISLAGVQKDEFIVSCRLGGHDCNRTTNILQFFDPYYYNCFTYNAPEPEDVESTLGEGLENGWSTIVLTGSGMVVKNKDIRLIPGSHERFSPMASSEGVRLVIHPPNTEPFPHTEGFDVPPGHSVSFGVKARVNVRVGPPHGNCSDRSSLGNATGRYRLIACQKICIQKEIVSRCGCADISLPDHDQKGVSLCSSDKDIPSECRLNASDECFSALKRVYDRITCVRNIKAKMARNVTAMRQCGCYPSCHEVSYDVTYSLSKWPAPGIEGDEAYVEIFDVGGYHQRFHPDKVDMYSKHFADPETRWEAMKDFSRLNVYIADSNVLKTEEMEDYNLNQLLSDIGGQLGLWVGSSIITLAEIIELSGHIFRYFARKFGPMGQGTVKSSSAEKCPMNGSARRGGIETTMDDHETHIIDNVLNLV